MRVHQYKLIFASLITFAYWRFRTGCEPELLRRSWISSIPWATNDLRISEEESAPNQLQCSGAPQFHRELRQVRPAVPGG